MGQVKVTLTQIHIEGLENAIFLPEESHWSSMEILLIGLKADILHHLCVCIQG